MTTQDQQSMQKAMQISGYPSTKHTPLPLWWKYESITQVYKNINDPCEIAKLYQTPVSSPCTTWNDGTWVICSCLPDLSHKQAIAWPHEWIYALFGFWQTIQLPSYCALCGLDERVWCGPDQGCNNFAIWDSTPVWHAAPTRWSPQNAKTEPIPETPVSCTEQQLSL